MQPALLATSAGWGILCAVAFSLVRAWRQRHFDAGRTALVFLASASLPSYVKLLYASYVGSVAALPPDWATFSGLAAVVALGLALQQIIRDFWGCIASGPTTQANVEPSTDNSAAPRTTAPPAA